MRLLKNADWVQLYRPCLATVSWRMDSWVCRKHGCRQYFGRWGGEYFVWFADKYRVAAWDGHTGNRDLSWLRISKSCIVFDSYRVVLCRAAILGAISVHIEREGEATSHKFTLSPSRVQMTGVATAYKLDLALVPGSIYRQLKKHDDIQIYFFQSSFIRSFHHGFKSTQYRQELHFCEWQTRSSISAVLLL